ncbi:hypothetical protein [Treponema endosymbiont of Eucomonympha sp.]|uniref:hypothetical protein n=1 Tax=Treponema endosymbiont of Eucomonympha sp. TaxID=1580831 RepID=UPI0007836E1E|nr:hypothetical protein [Treponema endosymbiont of Eucomonympha sp.]
MADKIFHYEVTKGYAKAAEGLRFDAVAKGGASHPNDAEMSEGLSEALGITPNEANGYRSHLKWEEI